MVALFACVRRSRECRLQAPNFLDCNQSFEIAVLLRVSDNLPLDFEEISSGDEKLSVTESVLAISSRFDLLIACRKYIHVRQSEGIELPLTCCVSYTIT